MEKEENILIVGQGIAGSCLSLILQQRGVNHKVIDDRGEFSASAAAAGIINPITGRRYVKTWLADQILPFAFDFYKKAGKVLNDEFISEKRILRIFSSIKEENNWYSRVGDPAYSEYIIEDYELDGFDQFLNNYVGVGEIKGMQLEIGKYINSYRNYLQSYGNLIEEKFDFNELDLVANKASYKGSVYDKIIFCEGYRVINNPFFNQLPFDPATGDVIIVSIPGANLRKLLKKKIFIVPMEEKDIYWIGSTYDWNMESISKKAKRKQELEEELKKTINLEFEVLDHLVGVRPAVKDRRPLIGVHPDYEMLILFNGLGTKGSSLAPYWAEKLADLLINGELLPQEVDLRRYVK